MLENTLEDCLKKDSFTKKMFSGVYARNELPKTINYPACIVVNTKPRSHTGEHWLSIFYDKNGSAFFFDSYGQNPKDYKLEAYLKKTSTNWTWNKTQIQGFSSHCGYYCLLYLLFKSRDKSDLFFSYFTQNFVQNDKKVNFLIKKYRKL
jgi:hypothetical protein